jgi:hypothetical protein
MYRFLWDFYFVSDSQSQSEAQAMAAEISFQVYRRFK